ncbi:MAG: hypothetical protein AAF533_06650 [Acidobacteriota bacterium]
MSPPRTRPGEPLFIVPPYSGPPSQVLRVEVEPEPFTVFRAICEVNGLNDGDALEAMVEAYMETLDDHERHLVRGSAQLVMSGLEVEAASTPKDEDG